MIDQERIAALEERCTLLERRAWSAEQNIVDIARALHEFITLDRQSREAALADELISGLERAGQIIRDLPPYKPNH